MHCVGTKMSKAGSYDASWVVTLDCALIADIYLYVDYSGKPEQY